MNKYTADNYHTGKGLAFPIAFICHILLVMSTDNVKAEPGQHSKCGEYEGIISMFSQSVLRNTLFLAIHNIINPRRMRSEGYSSRSVCLSVCLFVYDYSSTTGYEAAYERYQQIQCHKGKKNALMPCAEG